jgi:hypothetical protein
VAKQSAQTQPAAKKATPNRSTAPAPVPVSVGSDRGARRVTWQPPAEPPGKGWPAFRYPPESPAQAVASKAPPPSLPRSTSPTKKT